MREGPPNLVIVDLQTGSAGGFSLARDMRQYERLKDVPVLILVDRHQDGWLAMQGGATRYLLKPVPASVLVEESLELVGS
jgi:DNA-binding response OmpR family regulator